MSERRTARRYDLSLPVIIRGPIESAGSEHSGKTRDISTRGLYFMLEEDLGGGSELDITLTLPTEVTHGPKVVVHATGKVVRVDRTPDNGSSRVGVAAVIERYEIVRNDTRSH
jgi:hypothetical protein